MYHASDASNGSVHTLLTTAVTAWRAPTATHDSRVSLASHGHNDTLVGKFEQKQSWLTVGREVHARTQFLFLAEPLEEVALVEYANANCFPVIIMHPR